ncbi:unnamed protein product [Chondrus crispus]|uniref:Uncharacterized protein n=1 Tax=Chondrus crispus TaxID=2769 RepID=R7QJS2_CHOCR|nr:unnamed protein product [Chondrus crispus]CDF37660.1 unnamed protein product [Chondrus crispus]|eukprot:XP_005717531.1 unnamed protein product [Chondrus crispus]
MVGRWRRGSLLGRREGSRASGGNAATQRGEACPREIQLGCLGRGPEDGLHGEAGALK